MSSFRKKVEKGVLWNGGASIFMQGVNFVVGIVLARLLTPHDFGLIAMILVFIGFANLFMDLGFSAALIQKEEVKKSQYSSVFWMNVAIGTFFSLLLLAFSSALADFYDEAMLNSIIPIIASIFLIKSLGMVQKAKMEKELNFRAISIARFLAYFLTGITTIYLAYYGWGVWALVVKVILLDLIITASFWILSGWVPSFSFKLSDIKELLKFSMNLTGVETFNYWTRRMDDLLIGKFIGSNALGYYSKAYSFLKLPLTGIKSVITAVLFPAMSKMQKDISRLKETTLKTTEALAFINIPVMLGIFFISRDFVLIILGEQWEPMIPVLKIFAISSIPDSVRITGTILKAINRTDLLFRVAIITKSLFLLCIVLGLPFGIEGVAIGVTVGLFINFTVMTYVAGKQIGMSLQDVFWQITPVAINALIMLFSAIAISNFFFQDEISLLILFAKIALAIGIYGVVTWLNKPKILADYQKLILNAIK